MGAVFSPILASLGGLIWERSGVLDRTVSIDICLPLKSAITIVRNAEGVPISSSPTTAVNPTDVKIKNTSGEALRNLTVAVHPVGGREQQPIIFKSTVASSSVIHSEKYEVEIKNTTILIRTPQLEVDDEIWVFSLFDQPIAYIIELSADDFSQKEVRQPGCPNETLKLSRPHRLFEHKSKHCETEEDTDDLVCKIKSRSSLFHVTNEMAGKPITVEHQIENSYGEPGILDWLLGTSRKE